MSGTYHDTATVMDQSDEAWKTLARFSYLQEALVLKARLESEGIETFIPEEFSSSINPLSTAFEVRLQVASSDFERATAIFQSQEDSIPEACPYCESENIKAVSAPKSKTSFLAILGLLFFIPMRNRTQKKICENCGRSF